MASSRAVSSLCFLSFSPPVAAHPLPATAFRRRFGTGGVGFRERRRSTPHAGRSPGEKKTKQSQGRDGQGSNSLNSSGHHQFLRGRRRPPDSMRVCHRPFVDKQGGGA